ncbi:hypothetical protein Cob_v004977 [Colletotrichum orbiculare MAFF 240422]|uniref:Amidoligase enzyme n=1 Tax=Colletotrichum orbiculare (strain 104-T / ATCC 96160 / CBS 514.97 / LARS 414 / MAFF 240422) TaxID=1213857 RepID=A0A484FWF8_COLOR|nr:hypothetical protein Cob_v004977 [Colletotrichum orbiculare MAFF 240422]
MTSNIAATPPRVSFGIELEFLVACVDQGEPDPDEQHKARLQPLVVIPSDDGESSFTTSMSSSSEARSSESFMKRASFVQQEMTTALAKAGLPVWAEDATEEVADILTPGSVQQRHGSKYMSSFKFTQDFSVAQAHVDGYRFVSVEMVSPAMYDMDISFDLIRLAVSTITSNFRCRVNPSCGFHVHVGVGPTQRIDARTLRNFAALLWAADPLISRLHAPWRATSTYSQSGRVVLATGVGYTHGPGDAIKSRGFRQYSLSEAEFKKVKYFGRDRRIGESVEPDRTPTKVMEEIAMDQVDNIGLLNGEPWAHRANLPPIQGGRPSQPEPLERPMPMSDYESPPRPKNYNDQTAGSADRPPRPRPPPITRKYPRVPGTMRRNPDEDPRRRPYRTDIMSGVRDLLGADLTAAQVGELMVNPSITKHINYRFDGYHLPSFGGVGLEGEKGSAKLNRSATMTDTKMNTIEFREAAGTLDMEWIATWSRICCRLLEWSRDVGPAEYMAVLRLVVWAQEEVEAEYKYDVIDFLIDLGLITEARYCEERLHKGEKAWWECLNVTPHTEDEPLTPHQTPEEIELRRRNRCEDITERTVGLAETGNGVISKENAAGIQSAIEDAMNDGMFEMGEDWVLI